MKCTYGTGAFLLANSGANLDLFTGAAGSGQLTADDLDEANCRLVVHSRLASRRIEDLRA